MLYTLENEKVRVIVDSLAAEVASFVRKDKDIEYMWDGDSRYWSGRNPILFPHVSAPENKVLNFKGTDHKVGNHGFARRSRFTLVNKSENALVMKLEDDEDTLKEYPYRFLLQVRYSLQEDSLRIDYDISSCEDIVFGFGLHPAFRCPLREGKSFADYHVDFSKEDVPGSRLDLSYELFEKYPTYVVDEPRSRRFILSDGEDGVQLDVDEGFHIFALWTPHAPFVCLEPWVNTVDGKDLTTPFEERPGNIHLKAGEHFTIGYSIKPL